MWFKRKQAPEPARPEPKPLTAEQIAENERIWAWREETNRRNSLTWDEKMDEAQWHLDRGELFMAYTILSWHQWPIAEGERCAFGQEVIRLLELSLEHAELIEKRRARHE